MRVLLVDTTLYAPTTPLFLEALSDTGVDFCFFDEGRYLRSLGRSLVHKMVYRLLRRRPLTYWKLNLDLLRSAMDFRPDVVLVVKGTFVSPETLAHIKRHTGAVLVNYATDDPFNPAVSTPDLRAAIPGYDLYACTKRAIMEDVRRAGARAVEYIPFAYKPSVHYPERPSTPEERARFEADVAFIGGADADRVPYFEALAGIPGLRLALYGGYWRRVYSLRHCARGFAVGRDYRLALGGAKIAIGLVRRANRDGHSMRTFEIPACGAFMLAERTEEHLELFREGEDAAFFGSPNELAEKVKHYLDHESERIRISANGHRTVTTGAHTYGDRLRDLLDLAEALR